MQATKYTIKGSTLTFKPRLHNQDRSISGPTKSTRVLQKKKKSEYERNLAIAIFGCGKSGHINKVSNTRTIAQF